MVPGRCCLGWEWQIPHSDAHKEKGNHVDFVFVSIHHLSFHPEINMYKQHEKTLGLTD